MTSKTKDILQVLGILSVLSVLSGIGYFFVNNQGGSTLNLAYIAFLYMPTPLYSLAIFSLIKQENFVIKYLKNHKLNLKSILFTILIFILWVIVTFGLTVGLSSLFPQYFASLASNEQMVETLVSLVENAGADASIEDINLPPSPLIFAFSGIFSAILAGFTINLLFAFGEEVLWRGFMWDRLKHLRNSTVSLITGFCWGVWHIPLVIQGYNYGLGNVLLGSLVFTVFCVAFSFLFTLLMRKAESAVLASALHGIFNAYAGIFIFVLVNPNPFIDGAIGIISIISMMICAWIISLLSKTLIF